MIVLSLFDGMSCGLTALKDSGIPVTKYYASEIDKYAIQIAMKNHPEIIQLGNVENWRDWDIEKPDLIIGGSPCQNLSMAVIQNIKHNQGLNGEKSSLFYEFLAIKEHYNPQWFMLENVGGMTNANKDLITAAMVCEPVRINSNLFSAQDRDRYYWTNIPVDVCGINDKGINLKDIVQPSHEVDEKYWYDKDFEYHGDDKKIQATLCMKGHDILKRVYNLNGKCGTLTCCRGGNLQKKVYQDGQCRKMTPLEYERGQTMPDGYTEGVSDSQRYNMCGNGWTMKVISRIFEGIKK